MKITKLSLAAIAAMTLTTGAMADALSNIKLDAEAKVWYETNDKNDNSMFHKDNSSGDVALKIGAKSDLGPIKVGITNYSVTTMGLENSIVSDSRHSTTSNQNFFGEAYIQSTVGKTTLKIGRQELNTPFAFTEKWNVIPNTFTAGVLINNDIENVTLIAATVKEGNGYGTAGWKVAENGESTKLDATMVAALIKAGSVPVNMYYYDVNKIEGAAVDQVTAYWIDASFNAGPAKFTAIYAGAKGGHVLPSTVAGGAATTKDNDISAVALKAAAKFGNVSLLGAYSQVSDADKGLAIANVGTGYKKTKLPTAGVYTDGLFVAQPDAKAFKVKVATKVAGYGLTAQYINNTNDSFKNESTSEIDVIISKKIGKVAVKAILLNRTFDEAAMKAAEGNHVRVIASYQF